MRHGGVCIVLQVTAFIPAFVGHTGTVPVSLNTVVPRVDLYYELLIVLS